MSKRCPNYFFLVPTQDAPPCHPSPARHHTRLLVNPRHLRLPLLTTRLTPPLRATHSLCSITILVQPFTDVLGLLSILSCMPIYYMFIQDFPTSSHQVIADFNYIECDFFRIGGPWCRPVTSTIAFMTATKYYCCSRESLETRFIAIRIAG